MTTRHFLPGILASILLAAAPISQGADLQFFIGTYTTNPKSKGIYSSRIHTELGHVSAPKLAAETTNPSFLAIHPSGKYLYAVSEVGDSQGKSGAVSAFTIDAPLGTLKLINYQSSGGNGPCHLVVDKAGGHVLVANYGSGNAGSLPIRDGGRLDPMVSFQQHQGSGANPRRQREPHAHSVNLDKANRYAFIADLGLDKIMVYQFDSTKGTLFLNNPPWAAIAPGSGPRHFAFHPDGKRAYVINEIVGTVTAFTYDRQRGELKETQTISTLPPGESMQAGYSTADIHVHPSGKFVYGSNRGHNSIVVYSLDKEGKLTHVQNASTQGKTPRNFAIDPTGSFLLAENQQSDSIVVFAIDKKTGVLTPTGQVVDVPSPVCITFMP